MNIQKLATKTFIASSLLFGITGITMILSAPKGSGPAEWLAKFLVMVGFVVLSSFGVSVGYKYLADK